MHGHLNVKNNTVYDDLYGINSASSSNKCCPYNGAASPVSNSLPSHHFMEAQAGGSRLRATFMSQHRPDEEYTSTHSI